MKKYVKKLTAAFMAVAMVLSLAVSASAGAQTPQAMNSGNVNSWDAAGATQSSSNTVANQGGLPPEVVSVILPTAVANAFDMVFDAHELIKEANTINPGTTQYGSAVFEDGYKFFFKNVDAYAPVPKTETLKYAIGTAGADGYVAAGEKVDVYAKVTVEKIYAAVDSDGKLTAWKQSDGSAAAANVPADIAALVTNSAVIAEGTGKDAIYAINEKDPTIDFKATGGTSTGGLAEYSYKSYDITAANVRYLAPDNKVYTTLGDADTTTAPTPAAAAPATKEALLANDSGYERATTIQQNYVSYKHTSNEVKIINKGNQTINVSMKAELSGVAAPDYTYAATYDTTNAKFKDAAGTEITTGPVIYLELTDGVAADTSVMAYDETASKGVAQINTTIAGKPDYYDLKWDTSTSKYKYELQKDWGKKDFESKTFQFAGYINGDDGWDNLSNGTVNITWKVKQYKVLTAPTVTFGTFTSGKTWSATIAGNKDNLFVKEVAAYTTAGGDAIPLTVTTTQDAATGATAISVTSRNLQNANITAKPASVKVTFVDQTDADLTIAVTATLT